MTSRPHQKVPNAPRGAKPPRNQQPHEPTCAHEGHGKQKFSSPLSSLIQRNPWHRSPSRRPRNHPRENARALHQQGKDEHLSQIYLRPCLPQELPPAPNHHSYMEPLWLTSQMLPSMLSRMRLSTHPRPSCLLNLWTWSWKSPWTLSLGLELWVCHLRRRATVPVPGR